MEKNSLVLPISPSPYLPTSPPPMQALSIPTWIIHISSVIEWISAIWLIWMYGEVTKNRSWFALSFAMLPALISAMCACTWHFFENSTALEWLVILQAAMTLVGNCTLLAAGWWIWKTNKLKSEATSKLSSNSSKLGA